VRVHARATVADRTLTCGAFGENAFECGEIFEANRAGPHGRQIDGRGACFGIKRGTTDMKQFSIEMMRSHDASFY
jgi:hypothetical protein